MAKYLSGSALLKWLMVLVIAGVAYGCGSSDNGGAASGAGTPTAAGAGTGVGGAGKGPAPVNLGTAGNFVILAESAISTTGTTTVTGNLGISPNAASFITGFSLVAPPTASTTSPLVTGLVFAADYDPPTPSNLTTAIGDKGIAYTDANSRAPDYTELGAGSIGGLNLGPATYNWSGVVSIPTDVTLTGGPNDVWIFQIAGGLSVASGVQVVLAGGALPQNIFWATVAAADFGTTSKFKGVVISSTSIDMKTGSAIDGRLLAGTAVSLDAATVVQP